MTKQSAAQISDTANDPAELEALWDVVGVLLNHLVHAKHMDPKVLRDHLASLKSPAPPVPQVRKFLENLDFTIRIQEANKSPNFYMNNVSARR